MKNILFIICILYPFHIVVADIASDYNRTESYVERNNLSNKIIRSENNVQQYKEQADNQKNKDNKKYYNNPDEMTPDSIDKIQSDKNLNEISVDAMTRPKVEINTQSDFIKNSQMVQSNAAEIASGTYKDCDKKVFNKYTYVTRTCTRSNNIHLTCNKNLKVNVIKPSIPSPCNHVVQVIDGGTPAGGTLLKSFTWYVPGWFVFKRRHTFSFYAVPSSHDSDQCLIPNSFLAQEGAGAISYNISVNANVPLTVHGAIAQNTGSMSIKVTDSQHKTLATLTGGQADFKNGDLVQTLNISGSVAGTNSQTLPLISEIYLSEPKNPPEIINKTWQDNCASSPVMNNAACHLVNNTCTDKDSTKLINGVPIKEPCWVQQYSYQCGSTGTDTCAGMTGCQQISSVCNHEVNGVCLSFDETVSCPVKKTVGSGLECGSNFYCLDGNCQKVEKKQNTDFGKAATELSVANSAATDVKSEGQDPNISPQSISIFTGHAAKCRDITLGIMNCCNDTGWAKGVITHCNDEESNLGQAKEKGGLVVYVGRYCAHELLGICTEHKKSYCIFPSRIAYDVQYYGRYKQLGRGFGGAESPDCSGISPDQIGKIDFDKVDLSNVVSQVTGKANLPISQEIKNRLSNNVNELSKKG